VTETTYGVRLVRRDGNVVDGWCEFAGDELPMEGDDIDIACGAAIFRVLVTEVDPGRDAPIHAVELDLGPT
jgi:hypothetical protein